MAVGRYGVYFHGMFLQPFSFPFAHLQEGGRMNVVQGDMVLQYLHTDNTLRFQYLIIGFLRQTQVFPQAVVLPYGSYLVLLAVPVLRSAINSGAYDRLLTVDGYTAQDSGRTVSFYLAAVNVGQQ